MNGEEIKWFPQKAAQKVSTNDSYFNNNECQLHTTQLTLNRTGCSRTGCSRTVAVER